MTGRTTMPSQTQNRTSPSRKSDRSSRRMTTLSFEQIDRSRNGIFTENISASSRLPRPAYVVREADVIGANMPETIKLSKHRSKIYVGLSDVSSGHSSHRSFRPVSRDPTSAATSITRTSIIDWTDNASDATAPTGLSGEFSAILPAAVTTTTAAAATAKNNFGQPPPGLETAEIFSFRSIVHNNNKHGGRDRSPRPPLSRGNAAAMGLPGVPRPPHNTPFPVLATSRRRDEFATTFRKTVTPKKTPLDNCNVVLLGGSITPLAAAGRDPRRRNDADHRERSRSLLFLDPKKNVMAKGNGSHQASTAYLSLPRFDLPVIDLKCVESPIANLGDLEEKGIRLVKLRRLKRKKTKDSVLPNTDRNVANNNGNPHEPADTNATHVPHPIIDSFRSEESIPTHHVNEVEDKTSSLKRKSNGLNVMPDEPEANRRQSCITTPSIGRSERNDAEETLLMTNRESYATPLLPDAEVTYRADDPSKTPLTYREKNHLNSSLLSPKQKDVSDNNNIPIVNEKEMITDDTNFESASHLLLTFRNEIDNTTAKPNQDERPILIPESESESESKDIPRGRILKRSSSLLTVPDSICLSERRPPTLDGDINEMTAITGVAVNNPDDKELELVFDNMNIVEDEAQNRQRSVSITVATQTTPPPV